MHELPRPFDRRAVHVEQAISPVRNSSDERMQRNEAHAHARHHGLLDGFVAAERHALAGTNRCCRNTARPPRACPSRARAAGTYRSASSCRSKRSLTQRMRERRDDHMRVIGERFGGRAQFGRRTPHDREIGRVVLQSAEASRGCRPRNAHRPSDTVANRARAAWARNTSPNSRCSPRSSRYRPASATSLRPRRP